MGRKIIKHYPQNYNHIFNISEDRGVIFYCIKDYLVFLSIVSHYAVVFKISIVSMCIMVNHFHILLKSSSLDILRDFVMVMTGYFTKAYNKHYGRKGKLFKKPFGLSQKYGAKNIRTTISYILNNPIEKKLAKAVEDYRWNFIAYSISDHPYSEPIIIRDSGIALRKAVKSFDSYRKNNNVLSYEYLDALFRNLNKKEKDQMIDRIALSYNCVDFIACRKYYEGDFGQMIQAANLNTGSDPDIPEVFDRSNDVSYRYFYSEINKMGYDWEKVVFHMDRESEEFNAILETLLRNIRALPDHFNRFLHLK